MSNNVKIVIGVIVVAILAFVGYKTLYHQSLSGAALDCASNTTCLPSLSLTGNPDGVAFAVAGSETHTGAISNTSSFTLGSGNTALTGLIATTCTLGTKGPQSIDSSLNASTTGVFDCAVTGLTSSYTVMAQQATSTRVGTGSSYWSVIGAKASTTAGFAEVLLYNNGPTAVPSASGAGSSTVIWAFK